MKLWIVMFLIVVTIVVGGLFLENSILKATDRLSHTLDLVKDAVRNNQWQEALELHGQVDEKWHLQQDMWSPFIHNTDLASITVHLARLKSFLENKQTGLALAEIAEMEIQLVQLYEQEVLTLKNVF
jgi:hypothetical protein